MITFDSGWSVINSTIKKPHYMGYRGPRVYSEPEAVAIKSFVEKHNFKSYISYHTAGQVLYWFMFQQEAQLARDIQYVNQLRAITGYTVMSPFINGDLALPQIGLFKRQKTQP